MPTLRRPLSAAALGVVLGLLAMTLGCTAPAGGTPTAPSSTPAAPAATPAGTSTSSVPQEVLDLVVNDLIRRSGGSMPGNMRVVSAQAVTWPDSCMGVIAPGRACAQVIVPGYRVVMEVGGREYQYHTDGPPQWLGGKRALLITP